MNKTQKELTSLEIRNLMLETLAYKGDDIDTEGKNFPMYGYAGSQADLFRLVEGLALKRDLIPRNVQPEGAAWGGSMYGLYEKNTTNFSKNGILKLYEEFALLLNQGIISPGAYGNYGANLPYFHVTDYGLKCIESKDILPYDSEGYLDKLNTIKNINEWVNFYVREALQCFNANCLEASTIMLGLAGEVIVEELLKTYAEYLDKNAPSEKVKLDNQLNRVRAVSTKYSIYIKNLNSYIKNNNISDLEKLTAKIDGSAREIYATYTRLTRNELAHPSDIIMERTNVLMFFITFVKYCELQYSLINYFTEH